MKKVAVYPGTFDPITNGHLDILMRSSRIFDEIIILVAERKEKETLFSLRERIQIVKEVTKDFKWVKVESIKNELLVNYLKRKNINFVIRGLRSISDFEYELQMALINREFLSEIETIFIVGSKDTIFLSSSLIREIALNGGDISNFVPKAVIKKFKENWERNMGQDNIFSELEKLKELLNEAKKLPFSKYISIERDVFLSIINKIELMLPNEVKEAFYIKSKKDELLREAYAERERLLNEAKEKQKMYLSENYITQEAIKERQRIISEATEEAERIRKEAENYAYEILLKIEEYINKAKIAIEEGKKELKMKIPIEKIFSNEKLTIEENFDSIVLDYSPLSDVKRVISRLIISHGNKKEITIEGTIKADAILKCVSCLEEFEETLDFDFEEVYISENSVNLSEGEKGIKELDVFTYKDDILDTEEVIKDIIKANAPLYPKCPKCR